MCLFCCPPSLFFIQSLASPFFIPSLASLRYPSLCFLVAVFAVPHAWLQPDKWIFIYIEPGQLILNNLLRDPYIITSDIVFQPIQYLLMRVRSRLKKREDFTCSNVNMRACPICLQHFQKLHSHRKHADDPLGCYNIARIRDYLCLRKGIPLPPHPSRQLRVHLYEDFNSLESLIMNMNQTFLPKDPGWTTAIIDQTRNLTEHN